MLAISLVRQPSVVYIMSVFSALLSSFCFFSVNWMIFSTRSFGTPIFMASVAPFWMSDRVGFGSSMIRLLIRSSCSGATSSVGISISISCPVL